jgi:Putative zinc- or iron-chelating domain
VPADAATSALDTALLSGVAYACRPDCGLCCYAEPLVTPTERAGLVQLVPGAPFVRRGRHEFLRSHPDGGACRLLEHHRCVAHPARPSPCREFPLTTHVGLRAQVTVVLTCPGVDLTFLTDYRGPDRAGPSTGFDEELAALRARVDGKLGRELEASQRRRRRVVRALEADGRWEEDEEVRRRLRRELPVPLAEDFPVEDPPAQDDGLALLPLFFDGRDGPVAVAGSPGGWELVELRETGGVASSLGGAAPPDRRPALSDDATRALEGYLRYWLERDLLLGVVQLGMLEDRDGSVTERAAAELRGIGAVALSRAQVLASVRRGTSGPLSAGELLAGIRAADQDLLDRASWGSRL